MLEQTKPVNQLVYGDNLAVLRNRDYFPNAFVDLIYLDPPFNSNASYNVLFKSPTGEQSQAQIEAFDDTWHWETGDAEDAFDQVMKSGNTDAAEMLRAMRHFLKENDMMAYLCMMAVRLLELHRVLKPTGSLYLHCDPTASHYLKMLLDAIFGVRNFKNEIVWRRSHPKGLAFTRFATTHDVIFYYAKDSNRSIWNAVYAPYDEAAAQQYSLIDENGRRYQLTSLLNPNPDRPNLTYEFKGVTKVWRWTRERMEEEDRKGRIVVPRGGRGIPRYKRYFDEQEGVPVGDFWADIEIAAGNERLGYPTQKPLALLERIISASSNEGDLVLDPFCGCGTTVHAAQKLNRRWIGIDITHLAISLVKRRLIDAFPMVQFEIHGVPKDFGAARELAAQDKHQFQLWALSMIEAQPYKGGKKGADSGIDGFLYFKPDGKTTEKAIVEVKGGENVSPQWVRALGQVVERERAKIGVLLMMADPTTTMRREASAAGFYESPLHGKFEKVQILTVEDLFDGKRPHLPWIDPSVFKKAKREKTEHQSELDV
ncbi:MAG: DNA methyltransferase [Xanthobacteraceae bacterium]|jgi:site-specific DNA-methyltransferase (adenine-specific)